MNLYKSIHSFIFIIIYLLIEFIVKKIDFYNKKQNIENILKLVKNSKYFIK